jgi:hypothetical protein
MKLFITNYRHPRTENLNVTIPETLAELRFRQNFLIDLIATAIILSAAFNQKPTRYNAVFNGSL